MKRKTLLLAFVLFSLYQIHPIYAQNIVFSWAKSVGGTHNDFGFSMAVDHQDNMYITGSFNDTVDFDPGPAVANASSFGHLDIFIQKLDPNGNLIWFRNLGGATDDFSHSIAVDDLGFIYITGSFSGVVDFDPGSGTSNLTSNGFKDIFILKLDQNGDFLWARQIGSTQSDDGLSIDVDSFGNVYTTGSFQGMVDFDPGVGTTNLTANQARDIFIQKLDPSGNFLWAKHMGDFGTDRGFNIEVDPSGNLYTTGIFAGTIDFDPGNGTSNLTSNGNADIFIQKLDANGDFIWAKSFGGIYGDFSTSLAIDHNGNIYTTGAFVDLVDFDPGVGITNLNSNGDYDIFIQKLDVDGNFIWVKSMGGIDKEYGYSISVDQMGNIYNSGFFEATVDFDPGSGINNLTSNGFQDIFIQKLDSNGDFIWVEQIGGWGIDGCRSIDVSDSGNIYAVGYFWDTVDFDPGIDSNYLTSNGMMDIFMLKLGPSCFNSYSTDIQVACDSYTWMDGITYTSSNNNATYTLTNASGCDSIISLDLTINAVSDISVSQNQNTLTANNTNATYQWLDCNNNYTPITNETSASFTASTSGNYAVELTELGCVDTSACMLINNVGINEPNPNLGFELYPTPATNFLNISIYSISQAVHDVTIFDTKGSRLIDLKLKNGDQTIDISSLKPGIFIIQIDNQYAKFIKE